ncbi:Arylsulfatase A [Neorhodopirellula lusitana]|uniref:Arylsulfatase A n=2 Tax=Neorhodopirellula lusitana TaxID=445327 RepID=A0ABY1PS37_9BACT|nr:Arylsulfatase A [Neorhodopirellula lusitana]
MKQMTRLTTATRAMGLAIVLLAFHHMTVRADAPQRPNVLFIAIDDVNDWVGPLGGHPQAKTPHLDRFCEQGAVVFQNAVCPAPVCCPSRSALLSGFMPNHTGVYGNLSNILDSPITKTHATLPEYFTQHGYHSLSTGKIFHKHATETGADWGQWAFDTFRHTTPENRPDRSRLTHQGLGIVNGAKAKGPAPKYSWGALSWGPTEEPLQETKDFTSAEWAGQQLQKSWNQPFFMAIGISKPHLPWVVPQEFFDLYDLETLQTADIKPDDLDDIKRPNGENAYQPQPDYEWVVENGILKEATRAYLASVSYADACLGVIFEALQKSEHADNTIVVVWGDHGYHLGEKLRFKKSTLWRESARTPLIVRLPSMKKQQVCQRVVNLVDLYPTLIELCGLPEKELDGRDISPLLSTPDMPWKHPGVTVADYGTSVLTEDWHYLETKSGNKEFYDLRNDEMEWKNLIGSPEYAATIAELAKSVPRNRAKSVVAREVPKKNKREDAALDDTLKSTRDLSVLQ